jgi:hypothetical protein
VVETLSNACQPEMNSIDTSSGDTTFTSETCSQPCYTALVYARNCSDLPADISSDVENNIEYCSSNSSNLIDPTTQTNTTTTTTTTTTTQTDVSPVTQPTVPTGNTMVSPYSEPCSFLFPDPGTTNNNILNEACSQEIASMNTSTRTFTGPCSQQCYNALVYGSRCSDLSEDIATPMQTNIEYCLSINPNLVTPPPADCRVAVRINAMQTACSLESDQTPPFSDCSQGCYQSMLTTQQCSNYPDEFNDYNTATANAINTYVPTCQAQNQ